MSSLQWLPFFVGDYMRDTADLTAAEHGHYLLLLFHYWSKQEPLPCEKRKCYIIAKASTAKQKKLVDAILCQFFELTENGFLNHKMFKIIETQKSKSKTARVNGRKGGVAKAKASAKQTLQQNASKTLANQSHSITYPSGKAPSATHPVWGDALQTMVSQGEDEASTRSFLGRIIQQYGEDTVTDAVADCIIKNPVQFKAYLQGILKNKPKLKQVSSGAIGRLPVTRPTTAQKGLL